MKIFADKRFDTISFALEKLAAAMVARGIYVCDKQLTDFTGLDEGELIHISFDPTAEQLEKEGFEIDRKQSAVFITAKDPVGAMYGILDVAETVSLFGMQDVQNKREKPFKEIRGIKFNLPYEPYDNGDPFEKNLETCMDPVFWERLIDFLAEHRYNCLSLWSENPFQMMFRLNKYPETCRYSDEELEQYKNVYKFIFSHAKKRGIQTWLITWNIRLTPYIAEGLGLPYELGEMEAQYNIVHDKNNRLPNNINESHCIRQNSEVVKDYFKECFKTLIMSYPDVTGIGTTCSEEMVGSAEERQQWVSDVYGEAVRETGKDIPFIMRTNCANGKLAVEEFGRKYPGGNVYISWKYSNAHMYSHPEPQFEHLWNTWEGMDLSDVKLLYTVRNDDVHTLRIGDPEFIRDYFLGMDKEHVKGYYWGADGYMWGKDFQHAPHLMKNWEYDFEKHWFQFQLLGRLGYNPHLPQEFWEGIFRKRFGEIGPSLLVGLKAGTRIIEAVNRLFWINYDFQWHPESLISATGWKNVIDFMNGQSMPASGTVSLREFVTSPQKEKQFEGETPEDVLRILSQSVQTLSKCISSCDVQQSLDCETEYTVKDLEAWKYLGSYYIRKLRAAMELISFELTGKEEHKGKAVELLTEALEDWKQLALNGASRYLPYKMVRSKKMFGWSLWIHEAELDIKRARNFQPKS